MLLIIESKNTALLKTCLKNFVCACMNFVSVSYSKVQNKKKKHHFLYGRLTGFEPATFRATI